MHFDLVSPERLLISSDVAQVDVPGSEGDFGVLAGHAPLVTTMRPGILVIYRDGQDPLRIVINGGFAEVGPNGLTVLADTAVPIDEFDAAALAGVIKDTEEEIAGSTDGMERDKLTRRLEQLHELQRALAA
jgi:F-type H+-transporting ATPase subunit epsilon